MSEVLNSRSSKYRRTLMTKRSGVQIHQSVFYNTYLSAYDSNIISKCLRLNVKCMKCH